MCLLAKLKTILCRLGFPLNEFCHWCGREQPLVWWCKSNEFYKVLTGGDSVVVCPLCFDKEAKRRHMVLVFTVNTEDGSCHLL